MSVLGACWHRPMLREIEEALKESEHRWKTGEHTRNKGKVAPGKEEKQHVRRACRKT
jgi:hypothetical protein